MISVAGTALLAQAEIQVVPLLSVTEQYDSNVYFTPKSQLSGVTPEDFITTITPQVIVSERNSLVDANLSVGAMFQRYVNNPDLDNLGINAATGLDLSRGVRGFLPQMKTLQLSGTYQYVPAISAATLYAGGGGFGGGGFGGGGLATPVDSGLIAQRFRTTIYAGSANGTYALSPATDLQMGYMFSQLSFGTLSAPSAQQEPNTVFNTTVHSLTLGPTTRVTPTDSIGFTYLYNQFLQDEFGSFVSHSGTLNWGKTWSRELTSSVGGGLLLLEPFTDLSQPRPQRIPATLFPTGSATVTWLSDSSFLRRVGSGMGASGGGTGGFLPSLPGTVAPGGIIRSGAYSISAAYNLSLYPSFVASAGPILAHVVNLTSSFGVTDRLTAQAAINYSHLEFTFETLKSSFDTFSTSMVFTYLLTHSLQATLTGTWLKFDDNTVATTPAAGNFSFAKHTVLLGLSYAFSPRSNFFKAGSFWGPSTTATGAEPTSSKPKTGGVEIKQ